MHGKVLHRKNLQIHNCVDRYVALSIPKTIHYPNKGFTTQAIRCEYDCYYDLIIHRMKEKLLLMETVVSILERAELTL